MLFRSEMGEGLGCFSLGVIYELGKGVKQDDVEAVKWFRTACEKGYGRGCSGLGVMYELGKGVRQSNYEALTYYGKACDMKDQLGCEGYAQLKTGKR